MSERDNITVHVGDCRQILNTLPDASVQCCVTSPPYWGLRDYGVAGQIGQEKTPQEFVETMVGLFREVRRILKPDGTCWINLGDSYATGAGSARSPGGKCFGKQNKVIDEGAFPMSQPNRMPILGLKPKDLIGIPWRVAFALQADGWWLRQDIIWHKPNPMPESVTDRCTKAHEYIFLLSKSERYFYDADAIKEDSSDNTNPRIAGNGQVSTEPDIFGHVAEPVAKIKMPDGWDSGPGSHGNFHKSGREKGKTNSWKGSQFHTGKTAEHQLGRSSKNRKFDPGPGNKNNESFDAAMAIMPDTRNKRSVWTVSTSPYPEAHFATYPPDLIKPCILAGSKPGDVVLDPFGGSGTTGMVALELGRKAVLIELNPEYAELIDKRTDVTPGLGL